MVFASLFTQSCLRKYELPTWHTNLLSPILHTNIGIKSLVTDTIIKADHDSSYTISTLLPLTAIRFDTLIKFGEIPFSKKYTLQTLKLDPQSTTQQFSLGNIINQTPFAFINSFDGVMLPPFWAELLPPTITQGPLGPYYFNANSFFKSATLISGDLDLKISNNLPVDIQDITIQFRNQSSGTIIFEKTNITIPAGSSQSIHEDLAGKTIEGDLEAIIPTITLVTNGLKQNVIDTTQTIAFQMTISNVKVSSAVAVFPQQDVIDQDDLIPFKNMGKYEIKKAVLRSGEVNINVTSTAQDTLYFEYNIPSLSSQHMPFSTKEKVNPGSVANPATFIKSFNFTDYDFDLTCANLNPLRHPTASTDTFNTLNSILLGRIRYSGKLVYLSLQDSLTVDLRMKNLVAASAKGYLGDSLYVVAGEKTITSFKKFASSTFALEKASVDLHITNGVGINGEIVIQEFTAYNTLNNQRLSLTGTAMNTKYAVKKAQETPFEPSITSISIDQSNSNITKLIALKPDKITYKVALQLNPLGNLHTYDDFLLKESSIKVDAAIDIPLAVNIDNLSLKDTVNLGLNSISNSDKIQSGSLNFMIDNQFPFNAFLSIYVLNQQNQIIDSLHTTDPILAGKADLTGRVNKKTHSVLKFPFTKKQINTIATSARLLLDIKFASPPLQFEKLFTDYNMDIKLVGDFIYTIDAKSSH